MDRNESVLIFRFTKDVDSHIIELPGNYNEILGINSDFIIIGGKTIELLLKDNILSIFIKNKSGEVIAKKFIRDFEADSKLDLVQWVHGNDSLPMYFWGLDK